MSRLTFSAREFSKIEVLLQHLNQFLHAETRSIEELDAFRKGIYPLVHELYYEALGPRFSDEEREKLNEAAIDDLTVGEQVEWFARLIDGWEKDLSSP